MPTAQPVQCRNLRVQTDRNRTLVDYDGTASASDLDIWLLS